MHWFLAVMPRAICLCIQAAKAGIRVTWASWNPQRKAAEALQQEMQSGQVSLQDTILAVNRQGAESQHEVLAGTVSQAEAHRRGWYSHPKPFAWPAAKDAQVRLGGCALCMLCAFELCVFCIVSQHARGKL